MSDVTCNTESYNAGTLPLCLQELTFPVGIVNEPLVININGRTERLYRFMEQTDGDGVLKFDATKLPIGFLSIHTPIYTVWFEDLMGNVERISIDGKEYRRVKFNFRSAILEGFEQPSVAIWE